uniref:Uncharacterized protein n=1 Tax=Anguilla anguilla TaxID=7936 RepID=A0A0E9UEP0_ANGAN
MNLQYLPSKYLFLLHKHVS